MTCYTLLSAQSTRSLFSAVQAVKVSQRTRSTGMGIEFQELFSWMRRRKVFATLLVVCTLAIGIMIGTIISGHVQATHDQTATGATLLAVPDPAVLNISTTQVIEKPKGGNKTPKKFGDPFQDFFDRFFDQPDNSPDAERSLGS